MTARRSTSPRGADIWKRVLLPGALLATAALALTGCSGGVAGGGDAASEDGPIKLGLAAPFSGS